MKRNRRIETVFFALYICFLVKVILFKLPLLSLMDFINNWDYRNIQENLHSANIVPLHTIRMYIKYADRLNSFDNLVGNVVIFIPFGLMFPEFWMQMKTWWKLFLFMLFCITALELTQLLTGLGSFDVDDILLNMIGSMMGFGVWKLIQSTAHPGE